MELLSSLGYAEIADFHDLAGWPRVRRHLARLTALAITIPDNFYQVPRTMDAQA